MLTYWGMLEGTQPGTKATACKFYYDDDVTPEEKERFEMLDQQHILANNMMKRPGYGLIQLNAKYEQ